MDEGGHNFSSEALTEKEILGAGQAGATTSKCKRCGCYRVFMPNTVRPVYKKAFQWNPLKVYKEPPPCTG